MCRVHCSDVVCDSLFLLLVCYFSCGSFVIFVLLLCYLLFDLGAVLIERSCVDLRVSLRFGHLSVVMRL